MKKNKALSLIIVTVVSIALIVIIASVLLSTNGDINQGSFRTNDFVISSSLDVEEINSTEENTNGFESMKLNLSQRNNISFLIANQVGIKEIYMDNITVSNPKIQGDLKLYQNNARDDAVSIYEERISIYPEEKEGQILVNLNIDNVDFLKDVKIPDGTNSITFDGTMLNMIGIKLSELQMSIRFNVNIVDENGKLNVCKFKFNVPEEDLFNSGISIKRQNLSEYNFTIEDNFIKKWLNKI